MTRKFSVNPTDAPNSAGNQISRNRTVAPPDPFSGSFVIKVVDPDGEYVDLDEGAGGSARHELTNWYNGSIEYTANQPPSLTVSVDRDEYKVEPPYMFEVSASGSTEVEYFVVDSIVEQETFYLKRTYQCSGVLSLLTRYRTRSDIATLDSDPDKVAVLGGTSMIEMHRADTMFRWAINQAVPGPYQSYTVPGTGATENVWDAVSGTHPGPPMYTFAPGVVAEEYASKRLSVNWSGKSVLGCLDDIRGQIGAGYLYAKSATGGPHTINIAQPEHSGATITVSSGITEVSKTTDYSTAVSFATVYGTGSENTRYRKTRFVAGNNIPMPMFATIQSGDYWATPENIEERTGVSSDPKTSWAIGAIDIGVAAIGGSIYPGATITVVCGLGTSNQTVSTVRRNMDRPYQMTLEFDNG